jgi:undecaprenyl-diphosphatase
MNIFHTIFLGIIEGITEFLPVSSTAHLDITRTLLGIPSSSFVKSFEIIIQLGAIIAVLFMYRRKIFQSWVYVRSIAIAFIPTGVIGFVLYKVFKSFLLGNSKVEILAILLGGLFILYFEHRQKGLSQKTAPKQSIAELSTRDLLVLGSAQALAVVPGISRSGAVIICGRIINISTHVITEFSFLLAIPTILAASLYDVYKSGLDINQGEWGIILLGFIVSFLVALVVVKWLLAYIQSHSFSVFGWYRVVLGVVLALYFF